MDNIQTKKFCALTTFVLKLLPGWRWKLSATLILGFAELLILIFVPLIGAQIINALKSEDWEDFKHSVALLALLTVAQMLIGLTSRYVYLRLNERVGKEMRHMVVQRVLHKRFQFFERFWVGDLVSRTINDGAALKGFLTEVLLQIIFDAITLVIVVTILLWMNPVLAVLTVAVSPATLIYGRAVQPKLEALTLRVRENIAALTGHLQSWLSRALALKVYSLEQEALHQFAKRNEDLALSSIHYGGLGAAIGAVNTTLLGIPSLLIFAFGGYVTLEGQLSLGELFAFMTFSAYFNAPLQRLISIWVTRLPTLYPMHQRIQEILEPEDGVADVVALPSLPIVGISARDLEFGFEDEKHFRLIVPSFYARRGEIVGITGPNGSGKSTISRLLLGLYKPQAGEIQIEGENQRACAIPDRRQVIASLPQELVLFDGSLMGNVTLFAPCPDLEELARIAERLDLANWAASLPNGWESEINAGLAKTFSGGQMQKIGLARLLYRNCPILLLDEPGNGLDEATHLVVTEILLQSRVDRSVIVLTHSNELLAQCDRVYRLRQIESPSQVYECVEARGPWCHRSDLKLIQRGNGTC